MRFDRRDAMKMIAATGVIAGTGSMFPGISHASSPDLSVITGDDPVKNVKEALDALGGMKRFVSKGDKVVIKPNMGFGNPPLRTSTTEPLVVRALAQEALNAGAKRVMVFDNPCNKPKIVLEICGIKKELAGLQDTFVYLVKDPSLFREIEIPKGKTLKTQHVAIDILEADTIINVPVAKSHGGSKVSFGMKNWMGVVKNRKFWHVFSNLHQAIADIATVIKPKLTVLDATRALLTGGPGGPGKVANLKTIVAGIDPVAVDAYGVTLAPWHGKGYQISDIPFIMKAQELGVGTADIKKLNIFKKTV